MSEEVSNTNCGMLQLTQLYMTHSHNLTWVEWLDADSFVSADTGGHIHTHTFDLAKLTKKISRGKYEDKEEPRRTFSQHAPFGVYQVSNCNIALLLSAVACDPWTLIVTNPAHCSKIL